MMKQPIIWNRDLQIFTLGKITEKWSLKHKDSSNNFLNKLMLKTKNYSTMMKKKAVLRPQNQQ